MQNQAQTPVVQSNTAADGDDEQWEWFAHMSIYCSFC